MAGVTPPAIDEAVRMQLTSPAFANFCIANLGNPDFEFLFSEAAPGRREYEAAFRAAVERANSSANKVGASPAPSMGADGNSSSKPATLTEANRLGPHRPWPLIGPSLDEFERLLKQLDAPASHASHAGPSGAAQSTAEDPAMQLVSFMWRRPTKTEFMVHRLVDSINESTSRQAKCRSLQALHALAVEHNNNTEPGRTVAFAPVFERYIVLALIRVLKGCHAQSGEALYAKQLYSVWEGSQGLLLSRDMLNHARRCLAAVGL